MKQYKKLTAAVLLTLTMLLGSGAGSSGITSIQSGETPLAFSPRTDEPWQALTLHIPSNSMYDIVKKTARVYVLSYDSVYLAAVKELVAQAQSVSQEEGGGSPSLSVLSVAVCGDSAVVNLSGNKAALSQRQLFTVLYGVVNTLTEFSQIKYVGVLWQDSAFTLEETPIGMLTRFEGDVGAAMSDYAQNPLKKRFRLFFKSRLTDHMLTEVREARLTEQWAADMEKAYGQILEIVIRELSLGPRDTVNQTRLLPSGTARLEGYEVLANPEGQYELTVYVSGTEDFFPLAGIEPRESAEALAMTVFDIAPDAALISVVFGGHEDISAVRHSVTRPQAELKLGDILPVYYPLESGQKLVRVNNIIDSYRGAQADELLPYYLALPAPEGFGALPILPEGVSSQDIALSYSADEAYVEISKKLLNGIRAMDARMESCAVYSIVNTLCVGRGVTSVQFFCEGVPCPNEPGRLNLAEPLLFNPGVLR